MVRDRKGGIIITMKASQLVDLIHRGHLPTVRFFRGVEDWDGYFDENMIAQAVSVSPFPGDDDIVEVVFYTKDHDKHNSLVEKCNYYNSDSQPVFSAREAKMHPETCNWKESVYLGLDDDCPFEIFVAKKEDPVDVKG